MEKTNVTRVYVCNAAVKCTPVTGWIGFALNFCSTLCKVQFQGYPSKMFCNKLHVASLPYHHNRMDWLPMVLCTISAAPYCKMSAKILNLRRASLSYTIDQILSEGRKEGSSCLLVGEVTLVRTLPISIL